MHSLSQCRLVSLTCSSLISPSLLHFSLLVAHIPPQIGSLGYVFAITNDGDLILHPLIRDGVVVYEASLVNFDFLYYEFTEPREQSENIRERLIDGIEEEITVISTVPMEARVRAVHIETKYHVCHLVNVLYTNFLVIGSLRS